MLFTAGEIAVLTVDDLGVSLLVGAMKLVEFVLFGDSMFVEATDVDLGLVGTMDVVEFVHVADFALVERTKDVELVIEATYVVESVRLADSVLVE